MTITDHCAFAAVREPRRLAWALLSRAARGPSKSVWRLIDRLGVEDAASVLSTGTATDGVDPGVLARANPDRAAADLVVHYASGGRLITPDDADWPTAHLAALHTPEWGPEHFVGPLALWVSGTAGLPEIAEDAVAVAGTPRPSAYGIEVTTAIVAEVTARGMAIAATGGPGIPAHALTTAHLIPAPTMAVLSCGTDLAYRHHNHHLRAPRPGTCVLVSEYPPGTPTRPQRVGAAHRLLAALTRASVLVEADRQCWSEASITWAQRLGRNTYAVPGPITSPTSRSGNYLIADQDLTPVASPRDIYLVGGLLPAEPFPEDSDLDRPNGEPA
ncbi:DNA-processing protein DprA [Nocardia pseudovaccinii]|uniref:DNA-processing protein DprA n=1 Tax=Nocardia pseudovaccinii TaxID=189540 RepID=UPI0007A3FCDC|nr:DNA-processing protein DprA [Nocardia pseudovaccinii]